MAKKIQKKKVSTIYQLKISLQHSKPPIWRRVTVPNDFTLADLHRVIQTAMGWMGGHLHEFNIGGVSYGEIDPDWPNDMEDEVGVKLNKLLKKEKQKIRYIYDFGDDWEHVIELEKILTSDTASSKPKCITGRRACPPEDCGGLYGYYELLDTISDPDHPEREETLEWLGEEDFDPAFFDLDEVNRRLANLGTRIK
jgi:hypothetical protein